LVECTQSVEQTIQKEKMEAKFQPILKSEHYQGIQGVKRYTDNKRPTSSLPGKVTTERPAIQKKLAAPPVAAGQFRKHHL